MLLAVLVCSALAALNAVDAQDSKVGVSGQADVLAKKLSDLNKRHSTEFHFRQVCSVSLAWLLLVSALRTLVVTRCRSCISIVDRHLWTCKP